MGCFSPLILCFSHDARWLAFGRLDTSHYLLAVFCESYAFVMRMEMEEMMEKETELAKQRERESIRGEVKQFCKTN